MGRGKEGYRGRRWGEEGKRVGKAEREKEVGGRGGRGGEREGQERRRDVF